MNKWGERRGLNPRHLVPQTNALPAELHPPLILSIYFNFFICQVKILDFMKNDIIVDLLC